MSEKKSKGQARYDELAYDKKNYFEVASKAERKKMFAYAEGYKAFLDEAKTEREACAAAVKMAQEHGFTEFRFGDPLAAGDKKYFVNRGKSVVVFRVGTKDLEKHGMRIIASHIDAPRIDVKQNPLYEAGDMAYLDTHYYGGVLKYQWVCMPLSLVGVVYTADGRQIDISIGEDPDDPVFFINDLLPHLGKDQAAKKLGEAITGEMLMPLVGTYSEEEKTKPQILELLREKYGITEEDFTSAELEIIPAQKSREVGLDRSLLMSHGHDDRVCSYGNLAAILSAAPCAKTQVALFADKEEIEKLIFTAVYKEKQSGNICLKRFRIEKFITDKAYPFIPEGSSLLKLTTKTDVAVNIVYEPSARIKILEESFPVSDYLVKGWKAAGVRLTTKKIKTLKWEKLRIEKNKGKN